MNNHVSEKVFFGPYFLPITSFILIVTGVYAVITKKVLTPPRGIHPSWMGKKWAVIWGFLEIMLGIMCIIIYFNRNDL